MQIDKEKLNAQLKAALEHAWIESSVLAARLGKSGDKDADIINLKERPVGRLVLLATKYQLAGAFEAALPAIEFVARVTPAKFSHEDLEAMNDAVRTKLEKRA